MIVVPVVKGRQEECIIYPMTSSPFISRLSRSGWEAHPTVAKQPQNASPPQVLRSGKQPQQSTADMPGNLLYKNEAEMEKHMKPVQDAS